MSSTLVLSGSIEPNAVNTKVRDKQTRASEYARAIRFYLEETELPIHFTENSGYDLERSEELAPLIREERVQLFQERDVERPDLGKGYEEFRFLDRVVEELQRKGYDRMIKVTGRYIVRNVRQLIPKNEDRAYIDLHPRIKSGIAISSFFICPLDYYQKWIRNAYAEVNEAERITIEKVLFQKLYPLGAERPRLLPREPVFEGRSGTWDTPIGRNPYRIRARDFLRMLLRAGGWRRISWEI